ncbi:MAG: UDP-N-acetylmuramoyl-tripeptide--D-alanyl-D-alanine ligase [Bacilli bacterium]|nr:UDP-N-acetylmuramoyl-tripeptide--D-alanyl-D-alanine ligase [Bacilli bacterium]
MTVLFLVAIIPCFIYYIMKGNKSLHMLQQNWYNEGNRYLRWMLQNKYKVLIDPDMFFVIFICAMFFASKASLVLYILFYCMVALMFINRKKKEQVKKPLAFTKRVKRLMVTEILIFLIPAIIMSLIVNSNNLWVCLTILGALPYFSYIIVFIANIINKPIEKMVYNHYMKCAKNKLKGMTELSVIGVTGSYGKTSSKNILNDILSIKYNVCPTPKNFNTPNGLMLTINNHLDKFSDFMIAEMGAFKEGEIKELCDFVHPKYGILTKIGTAHMDSFGSQENIQKGKFELIENLPKDGVGVLNCDDELQVSYKLKNKCKILWVGIDNKKADVVASNIKQSYKGMTFDVEFRNLNDKTKYQFETKLLGIPNVYNILAGLALGSHFGIPVEQLMQGVKKVRSIEHRLELKKYGDINIIDDAYNSNPVGSKMALDVLSLMPGKKIIVTPGMIELGDRQYDLNKQFGMQIADVCDAVILVGEEQTKPIYDGLMEKKYKEKNIYVINDVKIAFKLMHEIKDKTTYVLLENDLPDIFNEK